MYTPSWYDFVLLFTYAGALGYAVRRWSQRKPGRAFWGYLGSIVMIAAIGIPLAWVLLFLNYMQWRTGP